MERLHKYMARAGVASRRQSEELIAKGLVKVNGETVNMPGLKIDPLSDRVEVKGKLLQKPEELVYILLYKPVNCVCTVSDPEGRRKVTDLLHGVKQRVYPVGRLDYDSEGLLLLTNDGRLTHALTHPSHAVPKTYRVWVSGIPEPDKLKALAQGIELADGPTAPAKVTLVGVNKGSGILQITIHEGRNRQVRRMCEQIGHPVRHLLRENVGPLRLGRMQPGEFRRLKPDEIARLKKIAKI
ncbi:MAG: rRNA pseudouridine synthase [Firmicutes bacterium]|nr:rRNA pseudouridine synthase [Bacillota bacterium]